MELYKLPRPSDAGRKVFLTVKNADKPRAVEVARQLAAHGVATRRFHYRGTANSHLHTTTVRDTVLLVLRAFTPEDHGVPFAELRARERAAVGS